MVQLSLESLKIASTMIHLQNDVPGNASIIPKNQDIEKNAVHTPCITRATK